MPPSENLLHSKGLQRQDALEFEQSRLWGSKRLIVAVFVFFGYFYLFMLRGNLSIAVIEMTSEKNITVGDKVFVQKPEFDWDSKTKGWILGLYYYGFCFSVIGGYLSTKYGGVTVHVFSNMITAILTILSPFLLRTNIYLFAAGRIAEGLFESFAYASTCDIWSRWIPKCELPKIVAFTHIGYNVGAAVTFPICGYMAQFWGWPMIFYFSGTFALIWCIIFFICVGNDPSKDKKISSQELRYLERSIKLRDRKTIKYPWKMIITSKPVWSLCMNKIAYSWTQMALVFCFPLYIKDITKHSTAQVGVHSSIPNMVSLIAIPLTGLFIGYMQNNLGFNPSRVQKCTLAIGFLLSGVLFIMVAFSNYTISIVCFVIIVIFITINSFALQLVVVGISPDHAGLVAGISAFWYSISAISAPLSIGYIVVNHTWQEWAICFALSGIVMIFAALTTALFGSSDDQKWLRSKDQNKEWHHIRKQETLI